MGLIPPYSELSVLRSLRLLKSPINIVFYTLCVHKMDLFTGIRHLRFLIFTVRDILTFYILYCYAI